MTASRRQFEIVFGAETFFTGRRCKADIGNENGHLIPNVQLNNFST